MKGLEIVIFGQVQGVYLRAFIRQKAREFQLSGFVRNEPDGTVRVIAEGEKDYLEKLAEACKKGSKFAKVERVEIKWKEASGEYNDFRIE